jgi:ribose transport system permease protein
VTEKLSPGGGLKALVARRAIADYLGLLGVLVLMIVLFSVLTENFWSYATVSFVANKIPALTVVAVGMTFVLIVAGIDLSVGSVLGLGGVVLGIAMVSWGFPLWAAVPLCLVAGCACGLVNGGITVGWSIPSFIVTLGMMEVARGVAAILADSRTMYIGAAVEPVSESLPLILLSPAFLIALAIVVLGELALRKTVFGRYAIAVGGNEEAARLSGIRTRRIKLAVFALCGTMAALAAVFQTSLLGAANPEAGIGLELAAIAAVVIGGTSLMGGRGSVVSSFLGVLIIAVLERGLAQVGAQDRDKRVITGCVIVAAAILDVYRSKLRGGR